MKRVISAILTVLLLGTVFAVPAANPNNISGPAVETENGTVNVSGPQVNAGKEIVNITGPEVEVDNKTPNVTGPVVVIDLNETTKVSVLNKTRLRERIREWVRVQKDRKEILKRALERMRERIQQRKQVFREFFRKRKVHWKASEAFKQYQHRLEIAKRNHGRYVQGYMRWLKAKKACEMGNCSEYLDATKDMLLRAINVSIERIQDINGTEELVEQLENLEALVKSASNMSELREIYPDIKETIHLANQVFAKQALLNLIETYMEKLSEFPEDKVADLEQQLTELSENIYTMEVRDVVHELKKIRVQIILLSKELNTEVKINEISEGNE